MIKFFRKIRQRLLTENKFSKYLLYAIGEIVLVVIGILIALSINNRNQQRINDVKITSILKEIQQELLIDIESSKLAFDGYIRFNVIADSILSNKSTRNEYNSSLNIGHRIGREYFHLVINNNGYDNLTRNIDNISEKYQPILKDLKNLYVSIKTGLDITNLRVREAVNKNIDDHYNQDVSFFVSEQRGVVTEAEIDYFLNDPHYKITVQKYMRDIGFTLLLSQAFRFKALETYGKIQELIESTDSIPKTLDLEPKTETYLNSIVGTYKIMDNSLIGWFKEIKISNEGKELHLIVKDKENDVDFKLAHHKENIFLQWALRRT